MANKEQFIGQINQLSDEDISSLLDTVTLMTSKILQRQYQTTHTVTANSHFPAEAIEDTLHGNSINYTVVEIGCSHQTAFDTRHKVLMSLQELPQINGIRGKTCSKNRKRGMSLYPHHNGYRNFACYEIERSGHIQPYNNFPAQSLHFRFGSVAPCSTPKSDDTASIPKTRYRRLAKPYPTGFSCYIQSAHKSEKNFLHSPEEISHADFSARTFIILYHNTKKM